MTHYLFILVGAVLVNNVVLVKILGLCPFMGVSKKLETAYGMGAATTFVLTMATGASYIIDHYLLIISNGYNFVESLLFGAGSAVGFSLVLILFAGIRERIDGADVPIHFRGVAIAMVTAGLMALAFMGFAGLDKYQ